MSQFYLEALNALDQLPKTSKLGSGNGVMAQNPTSSAAGQTIYEEREIATLLMFQSCSRIPDEKSIIEEEHNEYCYLEPYCNPCALELKLKQQVDFWEKKISTLIPDEWSEDNWTDILRDENNPSFSKDEPRLFSKMTLLEKRLEIVYWVDPAILELWLEGFPKSSHKCLSNLKQLIKCGIPYLNQSYNWDVTIEYLSHEIELQMLGLNLSL